MLQLNKHKFTHRLLKQIRKMQCSIQDRSAHYIFQAREEHPKLVDEFLNLATERIFQCLLSDQFKKKIFDGTANSMKLTVENNINFEIDKAVIDWEKKHIEDIFLETVKQKFGEKCFEYCKTLKLLRDTLEKLEYTTSWSTLIIPTGVVGSVVGGTILNPVVGASLATVGITGIVIWKGIFNEFEASREKTFRKKWNRFHKAA